jgi:hypothetical protein
MKSRSISKLESRDVAQQTGPLSLSISGSGSFFGFPVPVGPSQSQSRFQSLQQWQKPQAVAAAGGGKKKKPFKGPAQSVGSHKGSVMDAIRFADFFSRLLLPNPLGWKSLCPVTTTGSILYGVWKRIVLRRHQYDIHQNNRSVTDFAQATKRICFPLPLLLAILASHARCRVGLLALG